MRTPIGIILIYSWALFIAILFTWWLFIYSDLGIPLVFSFEPRISIYGLALSACIITLLIFAEKSLLKNKRNINILNLTLYGGAIALLSQIVFQVFMLFFDEADHIITRILAMVIIEVVICFLIAFQLKTKKTGILVGMIVCFLIVFKLMTLLFPGMVG